MSYCVFCYKTKSTPPTNWPLAMMICPQHLRKPFGLEVQYYKQETETEQQIVGPFLRVAENVFFKKNTVVFPCREYVEKRFRPEKAAYQVDEYDYHMNPEIEVWFRAISEKAASGAENDLLNGRYSYEVLRNFSSPYQTLALSDPDSSRFINFYAILQQSLSRAEQKIALLPVSKQFEEVELKTRDKADASGKVTTKLSDIKDMSESYKVLLVHCMLGEHETNVRGVGLEISRVPFNMVYRPGIGVVTTEDMGHPHHLVLSGKETGKQIWYMNKVSTVKKNVHTRSTTARDVQGFFATAHSLQGASNNCLF